MYESMPSIDWISFLKKDSLLNLVENAYENPIKNVFFLNFEFYFSFSMYFFRWIHKFILIFNMHSKSIRLFIGILWRIEKYDLFSAKAFVLLCQQSFIFTKLILCKTGNCPSIGIQLKAFIQICIAWSGINLRLDNWHTLNRQPKWPKYICYDKC